MPSGASQPGKSLNPNPLGQNIHGNAHWMKSEEADAIGLNNPVGVVLGQRTNGDLIRFNGDGHIMVFAPTGAGKGIGFVQPNLVDYRGSMVILDPKGENAIMAAAYRRDQLGQKVMVLDPFGMTREQHGKYEIHNFQSDSYNPLGALTFAGSSNLAPWLELIADALIPSQSERDKHWTDGAKRFVVMVLWYLVAHEPPKNRNLVRFFDLVSGGRDLMYKIATVLSEGRSEDPTIARSCREKGNWYLDREEKEISYFESVGANYFGWIGDAVWEGVLGGAPSPPLPLKTAEKGMTVFLCLPFHRMERYQSWLRLMVADLLSSLYEVQGAPEIPVLFLLDEAYAGLGRMPSLTKAAAGVRSAGARLCFIYQDVGQVNELYGHTWETFVANSGVTLFWSVNDSKAAQFISARCGTKTTPVPGNPVGMAEPLMRVETLSTLPPDEVIGLFRNSSPAKFTRCNALEDMRFKTKLAPNTTYGRPVEKEYEARTGFVPIDLGSVISKKRNSDLDEEDDAPILTTRERELAAMADITGLPLKFLQTLEAQNGKVLLRGDELGFINERGMFEPLLSPGD